ncbi:MAG: hypothetical protein M3Q95_02825 [Bacteroidota bacterium]|nr:hypothetical protein [Bacteroidota bacterium]
MKVNNYLSDEENEKCQCITFDENGRIMGSCDTLFQTSRLTASGIKREFPFLWKIISHFQQNKDTGDALFFPQVEFECNGYYSVCDFTFMKSEDARGIQKFIWMIYDNSIHYKELLTRHVSGKPRKTRLSF